jgi:meso-butanediol dehydrogenase/(S,S)-butanediol dehydrogenase/diacetyl reductase
MTLQQPLTGKTALVTGGASGIGAAIARAFIAEGAKVCITGRHRERLEQQAEDLPSGSATVCAGDVSREEDVRRMVEATIALADGVDILVNNAAHDVFGSITELKPGDWQRVLDVNLTGPFLLMRETLPHMVRKGSGSIINISSIAGIRCMPGAPAYATTKAGLILLTQQAALDYGPSGVRCNVVCPGATRTEMLEEAISEMANGMGTDFEGAMTRFCSQVPLRRISLPSEVASVCAFLASEASSFMNGSVLVVDGGANVVDVSGASVASF